MYNDCTALYVGQIKRQPITRVKEHKATINRPADSLSVVSNHRLTGHAFGWDEVKILDKEPSYLRRIISEMIYIIRQKNSFQ